MVTRKTMFPRFHALFQTAFSLQKHFRQPSGHKSAAVEQRRRPVFLLTLILLFATVGISEANFEGTIGTRFTIYSTGSSGNFGTKKPTVYAEYEKRPGVIKRVNVKVEKSNDISATCLWTNPLSPGTYNLWVKPNIGGAAPSIIDTFSVMNPAVDNITPNTLSTGTKIILNGRFFTNKKPLVYLKDLVSLKRKNCKVVNFTMDPVTGVSSLNFVMPKWESNNYDLILQTQVGEASFTYPPNPLEHWNLRNPISGTKVTFGNGIFVSVGKGIFTSTDGIHWTRRSFAPGFDITYGNDTLW